MDAEMLKTLGSASAQLVLAAGYIPACLIVRILWKRLNVLHEKVWAVMVKSNDDNDRRRELSEMHAKAVDKMADAIKDLERERRHVAR